MAVLSQRGVQLTLQIRQRPGLGPRRRPPPSAGGGQAVLPSIKQIAFKAQFLGDYLGRFAALQPVLDGLRIPTLSDTCSNSCRTAFQSCRTVIGAKRRAG